MATHEPIGPDLESFWEADERRRRERKRRRLDRPQRQKRQKRHRPLRPTRRDHGNADGQDSAHELVVLWRTRGGRVLALLCAAVLGLTMVGLVVLWPGHVRRIDQGAFGGHTRAATIVSSRLIPCQGPTRQSCRQVSVGVDGKQQRITLGPVGTLTPVSEPGTHIRVIRVPDVKGVPASAERYQYADVDRRGGLKWLAVLFLLVAVVALRFRGALAALGVLVSIGLIVAFMIPALLDDRPAVLVALVCSLAVAFVTVGLTHGLSAPSLAAVLGIAATLLLSAGLAELAVGLVHLDGRSSELSQFLNQQRADVSLKGVVLAGMLVGALGVLADTAVTQSSAVVALRRANPGMGPRQLYSGAISVGRDHLAATIHTLVLAYAGTALPLLLVLRSSSVTAVDAINTEDVAEPIVATLVGCLALIAAVPLTTALASFLVSRTPAAALGDAHHGHAH